MTQVRIAIATDHLVANHAMAGIANSSHRFAGQRQPETWPPGARVVLVRRRKQLSITACATVRAVILVIDIFAGERTFRAFVLRDLVGFITEPLTQVFVCFVALSHGFVLAGARARIKFKKKIIHSLYVFGRVFQLCTVRQQGVVQHNLRQCREAFFI